jgi:hypothetical protein
VRTLAPSPTDESLVSTRARLDRSFSTALLAGSGARSPEGAELRGQVE